MRQVAGSLATARPCGRVALCFALLSLGACSGLGEDAGLDSLDTAAIDARLQFLASDLLEGRAPGTRGAELAASYIATQFAEAGLEPAVGDSSYLQPVPMIARSFEPRLTFRASGGAALAPAYGEGFLAWPRDTATELSVEAELVFVGFGITAPEYKWDDYRDIDVRGDILLALDGDPGPHQPGRFRGDTATRYGSALYKYAEAERRGAAGMFLVHSPYLGYAWDAIRNVRSGEQLSLADGLGSEGLAIAGWLTSEVAAQVAAMGGLDFPTLLETARDSDFRPIETGVSVSVTAVSRTRRVLAANVAGVLPGRDPEKAQEAVVFVAHYDHLGIGAGAEGDSIYNGAYDNASGTALLIALADAFGGLSRRPARSLLFLAVTGKEAGCLGSRYYVKHPLFPLARTVASITIDGANLWGPTEDIVVIAGEAAGMREAAAEAAHNEGLRLETTFAPEWGFAYRSDEVCLADAGIPSVLLGHGRDYVGRMPGWGRERLEEYFRTAYHTPNDEYEPGLDLRGATQQARVAFRLGLYLSGTAWQP